HIVGEKEMDLREGSAQVQALWDRYKAKKAAFERKGWKTPNEPTGQIREMRLHILGHAETKAQLRAIRSLGIKTSYTVEELRKPFVVARLMWTGQTDDPQLRGIFAEKIADSMLSGRRALFGQGGESFAPNRSGPAPLKLAGAPPVGSVALDEDDDGYGDDRGGTPPQQQREPQRDEPPRAETKEQGEKPAKASGRRSANAGPTLPAG